MYNFVAVGYTHEDVVYQWTSGRGVNIASDMKLSQFDLISTPTGNATLSRSTGEWVMMMMYAFVSNAFSVSGMRAKPSR